MKIAAAPLGPFETNAYLVVAENGKDCCVVDAPKDAGPLLLAEIKKQGLNLTHLLITHGHWDHMCDGRYFADAGAKVIAHKDDQQLIENIEAYRNRYQSMIPSLSDDDFRSVNKPCIKTPHCGVPEAEFCKPGAPAKAGHLKAIRAVRHGMALGKVPLGWVSLS